MHCTDFAGLMASLPVCAGSDITTLSALSREFLFLLVSPSAGQLTGDEGLDLDVKGTLSLLYVVMVSYTVPFNTIGCFFW